MTARMPWAWGTGSPTMQDPGDQPWPVSSVSLQGIQGHGYYDTCCIPIIENTARECELTASLREAILKYPGTQAVLVRRHGVYVWGNDWIQAKTQVRPWLSLQVVPKRFAP